MGAFAYCNHPGCNLALSAPSAREDIMSEWECGYGHVQPRRYSNEEWIIMLYDNVLELTQQLEEK